LLFSTTDPRPSARRLTFGLSVAQVREVLDPLPMLPVPIASPFMLGLVDWRGQPVPVIDLSLRLGLGPSRLEDSRLLIARVASEGALVGFPVRPQVRVQTLPLAHEPVSRRLFGQWSLTRGVFELSSETLVVPDLDHLLLAPRVAAGSTDELGLPSVPATS
jgi:chemotaxis signal transduction protein